MKNNEGNKKKKVIPIISILMVLAVIGIVFAVTLPKKTEPVLEGSKTVVSGGTVTAPETPTKDAKKETESKKDAVAGKKAKTDNKKDSKQGSHTTGQTTGNTYSDNSYGKNGNANNKPFDSRESVGENTTGGNTTGGTGTGGNISNGGNTIGGNSTSGGEEKPQPVHTHTWVEVTHQEPVYETIHHDAVTHQEEIPHTVAVGRVEVCNACGFADPDPFVVDDHIWTVHDGGSSHRETQYETTYTYETVVDQAAWDETVKTGMRTVFDGYRCSGCGAAK